MKEDEFISDFDIRLCDIDKISFALGEKMSEEKLVRKILKSLPKKFDMKVAAIEEAQDLSSIKVDELIGFLQNFGMAINDRYENKNMSIKFVSNTEENEDQCEKDTGKSLPDVISLLGRKFNKALKRLRKRSSRNVNDKGSDNFKKLDSNTRSKMNTNQTKTKEYNVMNVKVFVTLNLSVPRF